MTEEGKERKAGKGQCGKGLEIVSRSCRLKVAVPATEGVIKAALKKA